MEEINSFKILEKLKSVYRYSTVDNRKESVAEHTWASLALADQLLEKTDSQLDKLKVYDLLLYHDAVEIITGDAPIHPEIDSSGKYEAENNGAILLSQKLSPETKNKYLDLFNEFQECKTREAKFAKAIDSLEADIHELDYKQDWQGWTKEYHISKKADLFKDFPFLEEIFKEMVEYLDANGYYLT
jgi:putative hydrolase of HD superfamily